MGSAVSCRDTAFNDAKFELRVSADMRARLRFGEGAPAEPPVPVKEAGTRVNTLTMDGHAPE
jgi:hypothetical protein